MQRIGPSHFDITLEAWLETSDGSRTLLTRTNHKHLYWDIRQQLVHHTSNGCPCVQATSSPAAPSAARPLELGLHARIVVEWHGEPIALENGHSRSFIEDGDSLILKGWAAR